MTDKGTVMAACTDLWGSTVGMPHPAKLQESARPIMTHTVWYSPRGKALELEACDCSYLSYITSLHSFTKGTWDGSLRSYSHEYHFAEYWQQQRFFFSGPISKSLTSLACFSWVSQLSYSQPCGGINNQRYVKKIEEVVLHVFILLQMRSTDHQFQSGLSSPLTWASFIRDWRKEAGCKCSLFSFKRYIQWFGFRQKAELLICCEISFLIPNVITYWEMTLGSSEHFNIIFTPQLSLVSCIDSCCFP